MRYAARIAALQKAKDAVASLVRSNPLDVPFACNPNEVVDTLREFETAKSVFYALDKYLKDVRPMIRDWPAGIYTHEDGTHAALAFQTVERRNITPAGKDLCYANELFTTDEVVNIKVAIVDAPRKDAT